MFTSPEQLPIQTSLIANEILNNNSLLNHLHRLASIDLLITQSIIMKSRILTIVILGLLLSFFSTNSYSQSIQLGYRSGGIRTMDAMKMAHRAQKLKNQKRLARLNDGKIGPYERMRIMRSRQALKRSMAHSFLNRKRARFSIAIRL